MTMLDHTPDELAEVEASLRLPQFTGRAGGMACYLEPAFELREAQGVGKPYRFLEGLAVPYGTFENVGWYLEQHELGSFTRSTKGGAGKAAPLLLFHNNRSWPIGHADKWQHADDGMHGVWKLNDTDAAQQAAGMADAGDLVGLSIGFQPIRSTWELVDDYDPSLGPDHMDRVTRNESRLLEVSMTPTPAFGDAQVTDVRAQATYTRARRASTPTPLLDQPGAARSTSYADLERLARGRHRPRPSAAGPPSRHPATTAWHAGDAPTTRTDATPRGKTAMPNAVLESFEAQRAEQIATMDSILSQVDERDLVDAERGLLEACRDRITELDAQIAPLREFEALRAAHTETTDGLPVPASPRRPIGHDDRSPVYASAGAFLVDYLRANGITDRGRPDLDAAARVGQARAVDNQTTAETPGLLPTPIIGQVVDLIDANRPLVSSLGGAKALAGIPGSSFSRPKITQHVTVGVQAVGKDTVVEPKNARATGAIQQSHLRRHRRHLPPRHRLDLAGRVGHFGQGLGRRVQRANRDRGGRRVQGRRHRHHGEPRRHHRVADVGRVGRGPVHRGHAQLQRRQAHARPHLVLARRVGRPRLDGGHRPRRVPTEHHRRNERTRHELVGRLPR